MRATAQNIPEELYVHHPTAAVVKRYPNRVSIGIMMPTRLVRTSGKKQYPRTLAERGKVRVAEKWPAAEASVKVGLW